MVVMEKKQEKRHYFFLFLAFGIVLVAYFFSAHLQFSPITGQQTHSSDTILLTMRYIDKPYFNGHSPLTTLAALSTTQLAEGIFVIDNDISLPAIAQGTYLLANLPIFFSSLGEGEHTLAVYARTIDNAILTDSDLFWYNHKPPTIDMTPTSAKITHEYIITDVNVYTYGEETETYSRIPFSILKRTQGLVELQFASQQQPVLVLAVDVFDNIGYGSLEPLPQLIVGRAIKDFKGTQITGAQTVIKTDEYKTWQRPDPCKGIIFVTVCDDAASDWAHEYLDPMITRLNEGLKAAGIGVSYELVIIKASPGKGICSITTDDDFKKFQMLAENFRDDPKFKPGDLVVHVVRDVTAPSLQLPPDGVLGFTEVTPGISSTITYPFTVLIQKYIEANIKKSAHIKGSREALNTNLLHEFLHAIGGHRLLGTHHDLKDHYTCVPTTPGGKTNIMTVPFIRDGVCRGVGMDAHQQGIFKAVYSGSGSTPGIITACREGKSAKDHDIYGPITRYPRTDTPSSPAAATPDIIAPAPPITGKAKYAKGCSSNSKFDEEYMYCQDDCKATKGNAWECDLRNCVCIETAKKKLCADKGKTFNKAQGDVCVDDCPAATHVCNAQTCVCEPRTKTQ